MQGKRKGANGRKTKVTRAGKAGVTKSIIALTPAQTKKIHGHLNALNKFFVGN